VSELHKIAQDIVKKPERYKEISVIGNLNSVPQNSKGRKVNRKVNSMPFYRLKENITKPLKEGS